MNIHQFLETRLEKRPDLHSIRNIVAFEKPHSLLRGGKTHRISTKRRSMSSGFPGHEVRFRNHHTEGQPRCDSFCQRHDIGLKVRKVLEARGERHRHRRRDGETLPGARGGVFTQKITPDERILVTILYLRKLCSQDTLAELFTVSRRTIGNVIREVSPALTQDGYTPTPVRQRLPDAHAVIDAATRHS